MFKDALPSINEAAADVRNKADELTGVTLRARNWAKLRPYMKDDLQTRETFNELNQLISTATENLDKTLKELTHTLNRALNLKEAGWDNATLGNAAYAIECAVGAKQFTVRESHS